MIQLELDNQTNMAVESVPVLQQKPMEYLETVNLNEEEKQMVTEFSEKIDIRNAEQVLTYGAAAQEKLSTFSDQALNGVKTKDIGEIGDTLAGLVADLKGFSVDVEEPKGLAKLFKKAANKAEVIKARYSTAETNVENVVQVLEGHQKQLVTDINMLDNMYEANLVYLKELTMYIIAGKERLDKERSTTLVELQQKAEETGLVEDAQAAKDFDDICTRFEKKLYDLELTRTISIQMAPQIRLIQNNDTLMNEKIHSVIANTIPLWKNQIILAINVEHAHDAVKAEKAVTDLTNQLIQENAEKLKNSSIEIAQESERGIIDIESVKFANNQLIETLDEVLRIQDEGREQRRVAEQELGQIEAELKQKLLDIRQVKS